MDRMTEQPRHIIQYTIKKCLTEQSERRIIIIGRKKGAAAAKEKNKKTLDK